MYEAFFGLKRCPFGMTPDPHCVLFTKQHREAVSGLAYAILRRKGLAVLTGDAGTGKTTVLTRALASIPSGRIQSSVILNPTATPQEFLEMVLLDFGISDIPASKAQRLWRLHRFLTEGHEAGRISALIVDEAHKLSPELLEEVRLMGNFDHLDTKLLQIVLAGQNELDTILDRPDLRQLKQRIAVRLTIPPLSAGEVEGYLQFRWRQAGGEAAAPFPAEAVEAVARASQGIPRLINSIADSALLLAFAEESQRVTPLHVREACSDLRLRSEDPTAAKPPVAAAEPIPPVPSGETLLQGTPLRTLDAYLPPQGGSLLARWAGKLGLAH